MATEGDPLEPILPHDRLSFGELEESYNLENVSSRGRLLAQLVVDECAERERPVSVLDIGCGKGIEHRPAYQWAIRKRVDDYWGIEPDASMAPRPGLFDTHISTRLEEAELPANHFDVAYSFMVMEHVDDPARFMDAVRRALKPGGVYLFTTPNGRHYFTRIASILRLLRLDETVLRVATGATSDEYHYPVRYRFNGERRIRDIAGRVGLEAPRFAYTEDRGVIYYFPRPFRFIYYMLLTKRRVIRNPQSLVTMVCRVSKPQNPR